MTYWTGRFESKHRTAKGIAESAKNVINITKTISERQQMRAASIFYRGMFCVTPYTLPQVVANKSTLTQDSVFNSNLKAFMGESDFICSSIVVNNQEYKNGDLLVLSVTDANNISVGLLQTSLLKEDKVYFVVQKYLATRNILGYFETNAACDMSIFVHSNRIADFKPLIKRGTVNRFVFILHHHISFQY